MDIDTPMAKICSGIKHQNTYKGTLIDLHLWGLVEILYWTKNQHRAHRIRLNPEILPDENINLAIFDTIEMSKLNTQTAKITNIEVSKLNKQRLSNEYAMNKQRLSSDSYSKQYKLDKLSKLKKLSQTDERNFLENLGNEDSEVTPLNTPKNQDKKGSGGGDLKTDILNYFLGMGWTAELAEKYYQTYSATNWTYNGEAITNWRAFAKGFVDKQPSQPKQLISQTYRGIEPPPNFW